MDIFEINFPFSLPASCSRISFKINKFCFIIFVFAFSQLPGAGQSLTQTIKGTIKDRESHSPLPGANIVIVNSDPLNGTNADLEGRFKLAAPIGRISVKISFIGYEDHIIQNILVATGKEVEINVLMLEKVNQKNEIIISSGSSDQRAINQMASISAVTVRTQDALRFAGGFYDPSRIVNSFAGIVTANSDESNDIVIRGNSSRGLLWRLEGIEIPNPNHFSDGQGGSGGAYSAISSNVISNFDFFTGAFPAEFGNALSGVMDLNLRKGNSEKSEFAFQTGMIGAEFSTEGPISKKRGSSFLVNARYVNFQFLSALNLIDLGEANYAPRSQDLVFNISLPSKKSGSINIFGVYGKSGFGKIANGDIYSWKSLQDRWEEMETQSSVTTGIKHLMTLPSGKSYIRSVVAFTYYSDSYQEGYIDSSLLRINSYSNKYNYPSFRSSILMNNKINSIFTLRTGISINYLSANMSNLRLNSLDKYDTLVSPSANSIMLQFWSQAKNRICDNFEINY
jgi:hypothetical protein